jgi:competence protein ComEA
MEIIDWFKQQSLAKWLQLALAGALVLAVIGYSLSSSQVQDAENPAAVFEPLQFENTISIHVVGEVEEPGLYELPIGAKAAEAIAAAGGMTSDAQEASINLARTLLDGEQLYVLSQKESVPGTGKLSLNQASAEQLDALPGIGPALSERIVAHRQSIGSFRSIEELTDVSGIGPKLFSKIRDQLTI